MNLQKFALLFSLPLFYLHTSCAQVKLENGATPTSLTKTGQMPAQIRESSGLAPANQPETYYTQGDAGTGPVLFQINTSGELLETLKLPLQNKDWESLARDDKGNLYICDCGNNENSRKDLTIYRFAPPATDKIEQIRFNYPDQKDFPPKKKDLNFDSEALLWHNNNLYLFSRDRGRKETSKVYVVPGSPGNHAAKLLTSLAVPGEVTGASLSPDATRLALLTKENVYLYQGADFTTALQAKPKQINITGAGQTEGIEFIDNTTLLISTEQGLLYKHQL